MPVFVLDTDILSLHQRNHSQVSAAVVAHATDVLCLSTVTVEEQIGGWSAIARTAKTPHQHEHAAMFLAALLASWGQFAVVPLTVPVLSRFDALVRAKFNVKRNDLRIAATALELGATVVTRNRRDFGRVPGLVVEDWSV
jgi:tRNA(fMet)-specific endonuclease VapC